MLTITKFEARQVLDALRQAEEDGFDGLWDAMQVMEDVLQGHDYSFDELIEE